MQIIDLLNTPKTEAEAREQLRVCKSILFGIAATILAAVIFVIGARHG